MAGAQMGDALMARLMAQAEGRGGELVTLDPKEAMQLSITLKNVVGSKGDLNKIRADAKTEQKKESAETARSEAKRQGLSKEIGDQFYAAVLSGL